MGVLKQREQPCCLGLELGQGPSSRSSYLGQDTGDACSCAGTGSRGACQPACDGRVEGVECRQRGRRRSIELCLRPMDIPIHMYFMGDVTRLRVLVSMLLSLHRQVSLP